MSRGSPTRPPVGRPRDQRLDDAILTATIAGTRSTSYSSLSLTAIAETARTTRAAIGRRWPTKAHLVLDAFLAHTATIDIPNTGSLQGDLYSLTHQNAELFTRPTHRNLTIAALAACAELGLDFRGIQQPRNAAIAAMFTRASDRGDLPPSVDPAIITQLLAGAVLYRSVILCETIDDTIITKLINTVLHDQLPDADGV